jgi:type II secretory pathway pseudopilin PulG
MNHAKKQGFTLIELMLAMAFIAMLLLAIALIILQISTIYNRGLTIKEAVQASSAISSDLSQDIAAAPTFSLAANTGHYVTQPWGGVLCLGQYSYVWNFGKAVSTYNGSHQASSINLLANDDGSTTPLNFAKVVDTSGALCSSATAKSVTQSQTVELLKNTDHDLAVHEFCVVSQPTANDPLTGEQLYTLNYSIGTNNGAALTTTGSAACVGTNQNDGLTACKAPNQAGSDLTYCTVQEFSLVVRTQNALN